MVSTLEQMQVQNGTGPGVRRKYGVGMKRLGESNQVHQLQLLQKITLKRL